MNAWQRMADCWLLWALAASAQTAIEVELADPDPNVRVKAARKLGDAAEGFRQLHLFAPLLQDESEEVRAAAVGALINVRAIDAQPLLIEATLDPSPQLQAMAVDGLVHFYVPDYMKSGRFVSLSRFASSLKARFVKPNPVTVSDYIEINPNVIAAIADVLRNGSSEESRANAARALGILRGRDAVDALLDGVRSRNTMIILESVLAIKKILDPAAGSEIVFLLRDLDPEVQEAVIRTVGQLRTREAVPELIVIIENTDKDRIRRQAMIALAKIPGNGQRNLFLRFLTDKDKGMRAAAAEGLARVGHPDDLRVVDHHFSLEKSTSAKLSLAFAAALMGNLVRLDYLVEGLNSKVHRLEARPFLVELSRNTEVLKRLYIPLSTGTVPQRRHLAFVLSRSGTAESLPHLQNLTRDSNNDVASAAIEAMRVLQARL